VLIYVKYQDQEKSFIWSPKLDVKTAAEEAAKVWGFKILPDYVYTFWQPTTGNLDTKLLLEKAFPPKTQVVLTAYKRSV
jgi:hypothetical protein